MKRLFKSITAVLAVTLVLTGCSGKPLLNGPALNKPKTVRSLLCGEWYLGTRSEPSFVLYDDGTCTIAGEYGTGRWSVVNDKQLKLTNYYGESESAAIDRVDDEKLVLSSGGMSNTFTRKPVSESESETSASDPETASVPAEDNTPAFTPEPTEEPAAEPAPEEIEGPSPDSVPDPDDAYGTVTEWNYIAERYYEIYLSYLDFINNGGDPGKLINVYPDQTARFLENYEKYNAGDMFYNEVFDFDVTKSSLTILGAGTYEADCYVHVINSDTEISTGNVSENDVTIHAVLRYNSDESGWMLASQKGESFSYEGHTMIRLAN